MDKDIKYAENAATHFACIKLGGKPDLRRENGTIELMYWYTG